MLQPPAGRAQGLLIDLDRLPECRLCQLDLVPVLRFGDVTGEGALDFTRPRLVQDPRSGDFAVFEVGRGNVALYDSTGRFLRRIGRQGRGPGETEQLVDVQFLAGNVGMYDFPGRKLVIVDRLGNFVKETPVPLRPGRFHVLSDSQIVVGSMDRSPAMAGWPLHLVDPFTGIISRHFGSLDGAFIGTTPFAGDVVLGWSPTHSIPWHGQRRTIRLERWTENNMMRARVTGDLNRFLPQREAVAGAPPPMLLAFGTDAADRLIVLTHVPDKNWQSVPRRGPEGAVESRYADDYLDTRIDVFDLKTRRHLGNTVWDDAQPNIMTAGESVLLYRTEIDADDIPRVVLYKIVPVAG